MNQFSVKTRHGQRHVTIKSWMQSTALNGRGPWRVDSEGSNWIIVNELTGVSKKIGPIGGSRGHGRGINYRDRAAETAEERNVKYWAENPPDIERSTAILYLFHDANDFDLLHYGTDTAAVVLVSDEEIEVARFEHDGEYWREIGGFAGFNREVLVS